MPQQREVKTCDRCRHFKRRCDLVKPSCSRCLQAGVRCSFDTAAVSVASASPGVSTITVPIIDIPYSASPTPVFMSTTTPTSGPAISSRSPAQDSQQSLSAGNPTPPTTSTDSPASSTQAFGSGEAGADPVLEPDGPEPSESSMPSAQRVVRKRKRNCLSCLRCHRLKVKCDKELPCGRCKSSGNGRDCYYSFNKGPNGGKFPCPTAPVKGDESKGQQAAWQIQHKVRGSSHWRDLMTKIGKLTSMDSTPLALALEDVATNACLANFSLPGNFPFGTPGAAKYFTREAVVKLVEGEKSKCQSYIDKYLNLLETVNPVLDVELFSREVEQYWQDPYSASLDWMSLFLMVLGLGCFSSVEEPHQATELMMAAEACLVQTPVMFRPTFLSLQTLTLMVVAKHICNPTCWAIDSCWTLLGMVVRTAFIYGLPQETGAEDGEALDVSERDARRKLWLTILYLDIKVSMCNGMPPVTRPEDLCSIRNTPNWDQPDNLHMVLYRALPLVLEILAHVNSKDSQVTYPEVLRYKVQIRELMAYAERVCNSQLQRITVDIFLRRCIMVLHRPFAMHPEGPSMFPESYWGSLECSLALLVHYREMWCSDKSLRLDLVGRAFVLDFFSASLTACLHVLRKDAPLAAAPVMDSQIPPRQIILDTLRSCFEIWSVEKESSVCYRTGYAILMAVLEVLPETSETN
ncbi:uncharacterized protein NECHADRAFT_83430 [Fusarium vanettenii 77-13-4]|uniref:Zn(2)-C6 fungal-type domain-containing protein n=1 Tax=Fusarium vanettenii (strain ATCC MYA-4622 / CBS 123669 / FGSC 9596 / NRRL 45880 / 77-13-4) TaxID=660122 RepID=C7Z401_FUSV7|nr:uncharacterized protein NECHADRAFT_83430 [Fusarium vanettenii 77-13-4]EEU41228.1 hypothetical protein NECHADRAFT_83430 [Fusarium vanettenii 77-13-4]